ncbi:glycoside hydrolase family 3 N-terminal domain-containing protein [Tamlana sp. 2_MG-2023]|uniref:glycoside hydrolase family 3 N-terminal domain-containing protein n=1 Tax=unclassified Tamlana TaxID=2614803 RepID=UPI0026E3C738|nr:MULTISPECIES: glycoside hydrolase family 3 N-terminal domain-containing protein [unclassified Tamlana]MDO6759987.1 glycoside hydrolase family 3 N-terminal domain-containing protein [Tamlana sp. 2_MG-2023]MDO6791843.1 glycoside hydrolase family 3 N-terminal domain-containing protein [Tamlana sp. 1_MG-2023]
MKPILTVLLYFLILPSCNAQKNNKQQFPYKDSSLSVETRVNDLLERMTLEEKISQMNMLSLKHLKFDKKGKVTQKSLDSLFKGGSIGTLESPFIGVDEISKFSEAADNYLRNNTRLGIPAIQIAECLHGQLAFGATIFPQTIGQGSTWNPDLIEKMGATIAQEASLSGVDQALSPIFDLARDPRFGRAEESFGEDPYLVSEMGKAFVIGMQGDPSITKTHIPDGKLMCTAKHYVAYSTPFAGINLGPNNLGPRELRNLHMYPFKKVIQEANIYSLMPAYNEVNGIPMHANKYLMKDVLRDELGFKGYVFSDYEAIAMLNYFHKVTKDAAATAISALEAGVDLEAPKSFAYSELPNLIQTGKVDIALIDQAVSNILTAKFKAGLFDKPFKAPKKVSTLIHTKEAINLASEIAEESIILLKNENSLLPINSNTLKSIAVIGPNADQVQYGDYSYTKDNKSGTTILDGIKQYANNKFEVNYEKGCNITGFDKSNIPAAVKAAEKSDVVVLVIGGTSSVLSGIGWGKDIPGDYPTSGEGFDRASLTPPGVQPELIEAIHNTGKPIVLVMVHGRAYSIAWEKEHLPAIVEAWYPGEQGGNAVAKVLFGDVNPSGKLTVSVPKSAGHVPVFYNYKPSGRGFYRQPGSPEKPGRDYVFSSPDPLFPFGHGLSYTSFEYSDLQVENTKLNMDGVVKISLKVRNTGKVVGKEVVQVYFNDILSSVTTPVKNLKAFKKVEINPSEITTINFTIPISEFGLWDEDMKYIVEPGEFKIMIGSSAEDIRLSKTITID